MTPADFEEICRWATEGVDKKPGLFFLVPEAGPLDPYVLSVLTEVPDQIVVPLMPPDRQEDRLGLPISPNQTVVAGTLTDAASLAHHISGRPIIIHVKPEEIARIGEHLLTMGRHTGHVVLRLDDPHLRWDEDFESYRRQLEGLAVPYLTLNAMGRRHSAGMLDISALDVRKDGHDACPVVTDFLVVGPDRYIYPCLAYYHAGREYALGRVPSVKEGRPHDAELTALKNSRQGSAECPGCPFLGTRPAAACAGIAKLLAAERLAREHLISRAAGSSYLLNCLRVLQTRNAEIQSRGEGGEDLMVSSSGQTHDVGVAEFLAALHDIKDTAERACRGPARADQSEEYPARWQELPELPFNSRRAVFRRRVREITDTLSVLGSVRSADEGGPDAVRPEHVNDPPHEVEGEGNEPKAQPLSAEEMAAITVLHERRIGWSCLLEGILDDREVGFPGEMEESVVREQLARAYGDIARWFEGMRQRYGWPPFEQTGWEIDFAACRAVPRASGRDLAETGGRHQRVSGTHESGQPLAYIADMDATIIQRLFEQRAALVDYLRPSLGTLGRPTDGPGDVAELVRQIGALDLDIRNWFTEMAEVCQWPSGEPGRWTYQVDVGEDQVYRVPRKRPVDAQSRQDSTSRSYK